MLKLFILFLGLSPIFVEAQIKRGQLIYWSRERQLQWSDFRYREPVSIHTANASTAIRISVDPYEKDDLPDYQITFRFNRSLSWTTDSTSLDLLKHEQYHFDIYELYARRIRASILALRDAGVEDKEKYTNEITRLLNECKLFQEEYDKQTAHGFIKTQQESWQVRVDYLLSELQELSTENTILAATDP
ncbi:MAG: DUF922 domain-containing protein [Cytophagales bacterium]|nr:DUF922 domain-containing protein [Cytophagales bacterium]